MGLGSRSSDSGNDMPPFERPWSWCGQRKKSDYYIKAAVMDKTKPTKAASCYMRGGSRYVINPVDASQVRVYQSSTCPPFSSHLLFCTHRYVDTRVNSRRSPVISHSLKPARAARALPHHPPPSRQRHRIPYNYASSRQRCSSALT
ncbi:hypothetical protein V8C26DRAFT_294607 [Trichoderma gracile]